MSFVHSMIDNERHHIIIENTIAMAQAMNMDVIAEGVETIEQLELLKSYNCNAMQGYLFSEPLTAQEVTNNYYNSTQR